MIVPHTLRTFRAVEAIAIAACCVMGMGVSNPANAESLLTGDPSDGLVFVATKDGDLDLWRARLADGALQRLTHTPKREERRPAWSQAAGQLLMITRNTEGSMKSSVALLDPVSGKESGLGPEPDLIQQYPVWSPNGKAIAHSFRIPNAATKTASEAGVVLVNLQKGKRNLIAQVEKTKHRMLHLDYAHDGSYVVARGRAPDVKTNDRLWLLRHGKDPEVVRRTPTGIFSKPHFTRDDKHIVYTFRPRPERTRSIMMIPVDGKTRAVAVASSKGADDHSGVPSPTRDEIAFVSNRDGSHDIFIAPLGDGAAVNLTKGSKAVDTSPVWSPDGERIAYVSMPAEIFETEENQIPKSTVRVIDRKGKLLFETPGTMPNWMPAWQGNQPIAPSGVLAPEEE